ncbi:SACOL1771 family peroxiredoxin [Ureibacillus endophyticus]|uniref:SACOL1771 family peroxiredoxin n=1 Tax=Ureibacillus endophyticus TaxID=1978490 RepID=A0A494Z5H8_9BACL|nr:SACOL1771 family peroxiredoxin [Lysinibacillus endophyticus]RKQ17254.1 SACOL1771 family peroxiredoxin [Lysinibacillus endophyticus]
MLKNGQHSFKYETTWDGGRNEVGYISCGNLKTEVSIPKEMNGPGIGTNPDELLLSAAATCYLISLATMLDLSKVPAYLTLKSEGIVEVENSNLTYKEIIHHVEIALKEKSEKHIRLANRLAIKAEQTCMISKAIRGNVNVVVNCTII